MNLEVPLRVNTLSKPDTIPASLQSQAHQAFIEVISAYQERKHNGGLAGFSLGPQSDFVESRLPTARRSQVSTSDFLCDVEVAAKRALNQAELDYFAKYYRTCRLLAGGDDPEFINGSAAWVTANHETDHSMRLHLGRHFVQVGLYPLHKYMEPRADG